MFIEELWNDMPKKIELLKKFNFLVRELNETDIITREEIFGVCKTIIAKLTDYFFKIIDLGTTSFGKESLFTQQKENYPLINILGQYILILMSILPIVVEFLKFLKNT